MGLVNTSLSTFTFQCTAALRHDPDYEADPLEHHDFCQRLMALTTEIPRDGSPR